MKPRVLIVGTAYAIREHRKKLEFLAAPYALTCATAMECGGFGWLESAADASPGDYTLIGLPFAGAPTAGTRCWYRGLAAVFRARPYDLILVENEPWGVLRWQSWLLKTLFQRQARFGEFTWENVPRSGWKGAVLSVVYRLAAWSDSFVVGGNQDALALMRKHGAPAAPRSTVLGQFGVDPEIFSPLVEPARQQARHAAHLPSDAFLMAYCGRLVPEKGVLDLLEAFESLPAKASPEMRLIFMGTGPLEPRLREAALADPRILLLPASTYPKIAGFLQMLDLLVLPSRTTLLPGTCWKEQFGHILIEAMACGTLTLGSNCGAIPEVLKNPEVIFPEGDAPALAALIQSFLHDPERARRVAASQRALVLAEFTHEQLARQWADFFDQCLVPPAQPA